MPLGSDKDYTSEAPLHRRRTFTLTAIYVAMVFSGVAMIVWQRLAGQNDLPGWMGATIALACAVPMVAIFIGGARFAWRHEGVEQTIYARSTSTAFVFMMLTSALFGLLEAFARVGPLSAWWIYAVGGTSWIVSNYVLVSRSS